MDVSQKVLEKLKCANCDLYLSCGPVYMKHKDGEAICGRCSKPEKEPVTQNKQYETVAELLRFPCRYSEFGCQEKLQFSKNQNPHEENCNFRQRLCPIAERGTCDWLGTWMDLLKHCNDNHSKFVLENPCSIRHDISKSTLINYLLVAFNVLFVLHTKVCCTSGKIFHAIRFLGEAEKAKDFEFQLYIKRNKEQLIKHGQVAPEGCLAIQENTSLGLSINSLLEIFNGFDDIEFNLTLNIIENKLEKPKRQKKVEKVQKLQSENNTSKCVYCGYLLVNQDLELCDRCKVGEKFCENKAKGCKYYDTSIKCLKHETFYCNFNTKCTRDIFTTFCNSTIEQGTLFEHFTSNHAIIKNSCDEYTHCAMGENKRWLLTSNIGVIIVEYCLKDSQFKIYSPLTSIELAYYKCRVEFNVLGQGWKMKINNQNYGTREDWSFKENILNDFFMRVYIYRN